MNPLIIAEAANPEWTSVPLVGWSMADAILKETGGHVVTHVRNRDALLRNGWQEGKDFTALDNEKVAEPAWKATSWIRERFGLGYTFAQATSIHLIFISKNYYGINLRID